MEEQKQNMAEDLTEVKTQLAEAKSAFRIWKKENKIRKIEQIKDEALKKEFEEHEAKIQALTEKKEALSATKKKKSTFAGTYKYGTYTNPDGEEIQVTSKMKEGKRWRNHARKVAKKLGITPQEVEWDPNFFLPKPKKVKKVKEAKEEKEEVSNTAETTPEVKQSAKKKRVKTA